MGRWNLYIGGAGQMVQDFVNIDIVAMPGMDVAVIREIQRVLATGGQVHLVTPFCHPYHEYPNDFPQIHD